MRVHRVVSVALVLLLGCVVLCSAGEVNTRPIIGIMSQPSSGGLKKFGNSYLAASYVKFVESAGARAVVVRYDLPPSELTDIFHGLNGLLLPGGGADISVGSPYFKATNLLFQLAKKSNDDGKPFPIWGTCLGFESLAILAAQSDSVLSGGFDSEDLALPLNFTQAAPASRMFLTMPDTLYFALAKDPLTMNNHMSGVTPATFSQNAALHNFFRVLSTNKDRKGREFISSWEAIEYPFYGTQWHPEKNVFEWTSREGIPHSWEAVLTCQFMANLLGFAARQSSNQMSSQLWDKWSIYNFSPVYTYPSGSNFEQAYFWN